MAAKYRRWRACAIGAASTALLSTVFASPTSVLDNLTDLTLEELRLGSEHAAGDVPAPHQRGLHVEISDESAQVASGPVQALE